MIMIMIQWPQVIFWGFAAIVEYVMIFLWLMAMEKFRIFAATVDDVISTRMFMILPLSQETMVMFPSLQEMFNIFLPSEVNDDVSVTSTYGKFRILLQWRKTLMMFLWPKKIFIIMQQSWKMFPQPQENITILPRAWLDKKS